MVEQGTGAAFVEIERTIVARIRERWTKAEIILLGGSRASGENVASSDWDIFAIGNFDRRESEPDKVAGHNLDVILQPISSVKEGVLSTFYGLVRALRLLLDNRDQFGAQIVHAIKIAYDIGPGIRDAQEFQLDLNELSRFVAKIAGRQADPESCFSTLGRFHSLAVQMWFYKRERWPLPPHVALPLIRREDPNFAALLRVVATDTDHAKRVYGCEEITRALCKP